MTSLVLMYLYYDEEDDIKAITPAADPSLASSFSVTTFPLSKVEEFLTGAKSTFDYTIKHQQRGNKVKHDIVEKESLVPTLTRTLDNYLTQVSDTNESSIVRIINYVDTKNIIIRLSDKFKETKNSTNDDLKDEAENFLRQGPSNLYFTEKNNPYNLLFSIRFLPGDLFKVEELIFKYDETIDLSESSVYTKKIIDGYGYMIKGKK